MYVRWKRMMLAVFLIGCMIFCAQAEEKPTEWEDDLRIAQKTLEGLGIEISDQAMQKVEKKMETLAEYLKMCHYIMDVGDNREIMDSDALLLAGYENFSMSPENYAHDLLLVVGAGERDATTGEWTALTQQVYAFNEKAFSMESMYVDFLRDVDVIVSDAVLTDIAEDLSGITGDIPADMQLFPIRLQNGTRKVFFQCNGAPCEIELASYGAWINMDILAYVNRVLQEQGCKGQLQVVSNAGDLMVMLVYGDTTYANSVRRAIGVAEEKESLNLVDWLMDMLF